MTPEETRAGFAAMIEDAAGVSPAPAFQVQVARDGRVIMPMVSDEELAAAALAENARAAPVDPMQLALSLLARRVDALEDALAQMRRVVVRADARAKDYANNSNRRMMSDNARANQRGNANGSGAGNAAGSGSDAGNGSGGGSGGNGGGSRGNGGGSR